MFKNFIEKKRIYCFQLEFRCRKWRWWLYLTNCQEQEQPGRGWFWWGSPLIDTRRVAALQPISTLYWLPVLALCKSVQHHLSQDWAVILQNYLENILAGSPPQCDKCWCFPCLWEILTLWVENKTLAGSCPHSLNCLHDTGGGARPHFARAQPPQSFLNDLKTFVVSFPWVGLSSGSVTSFGATLTRSKVSIYSLDWTELCVEAELQDCNPRLPVVGGAEGESSHYTSLDLIAHIIGSRHNNIIQLWSPSDMRYTASHGLWLFGQRSIVSLFWR